MLYCSNTFFYKCVARSKIQTHKTSTAPTTMSCLLTFALIHVSKRRTAHFQTLLLGSQAFAIHPLASTLSYVSPSWKATRSCRCPLTEKTRRVRKAHRSRQWPTSASRWPTDKPFRTWPKYTSFLCWSRPSACRLGTFCSRYCVYFTLVSLKWKLHIALPVCQKPAT